MSPKILVENIEQLVSLPDVFVKVNRLMDSSEYSAMRMGEIISQDTDLSARLLRLANSPFYGLRAPVDTISRAVTLIGTQELRNLVLASSAIRLFTGIPADLVDMGAFWSHSIMTGGLARELAVRCNVLHSERLFVMGVLHDIGRLVIYLVLPDQARDILLITGGDDWLSPQAEQDVLGFTHMEVGAQLLRAWGLPDGLVQVIWAHHCPDKAGAYQFDASLLHIAIVICNGYMFGLSFDEILANIHPSIWQLTDLDRQDLQRIAETLPDKLAEAMEFIHSPPEGVHSSSGHCPD